MEILKGVLKRSIFIIPPLILASFFIESRRLPLGIFLGWLFGIINLRALTKNVEGLLGPEKATARIVVLNITRLLAMSAAIFMIVYYRIVNAVGLLIGFTIVFSLVLIEGWKVGKSK
jgi:hypothetical protein